MHPLFATDDLSAIPVTLLRPADRAAWADANGALGAAANRLEFKAQAGRVLPLTDATGALVHVLLGLGEHGDAMTVGALARALPEGVFRIADLPEGLDPTLAATAFLMGGYVFGRYKRKPTEIRARLVPPPGADIAAATRTAEAVALVRDLVNTPAQDMGPVALEAAARAVADAHGATVESVVGEDLLTQGYPAIHAVGRAAAEAPRHVRLTWTGPDASTASPLVALVGKGVCFDSGGLDIKPAAGMRHMKKDMGGAAHALALAQLVMRHRLPVRLSVDLAMVENAIGAGAFRPGDILSSRAGTTIEIDNTDAEGRLILADALARACEDKPALLIDFATLTGAARIALGGDLPPFFTDDDALAAEIETSARRTLDPCWRLPLWQGYEAELDSPVADICNTGKSGLAGAVIAALFLKRFVSAPSWVHLDVFAWNASDRPGRPAGGEAMTLRLFEDLLFRRYGPSRASGA
jgi:leucyl aminopeptidase